ncbi:MAG: cyclodeaminase/cyclohydrolase family protein [Proteobacteria bacterium]|nr:cyclodeaminase/cyclohydrolase family protein [Pseudomonadota bacterium]
MIKDKSLQVFLDELASSAPTPGGGSGAAIMGAMGAALVSMVCNLTVGKKGYEEVEDHLKDVLKQAEALRDRLTDMIRADVEVFDRLMASYGLPKETDEEKSVRSEEIQASLKEATDVPLNCARACAEAIELCRDAAEKGNLNVISDAGVAVVAADAAMKSAALNVYINVGSIKDKAFAEERSTELEKILKGADGQTSEIYELVKSKL